MTCLLRIFHIKFLQSLNKKVTNGVRSLNRHAVSRTVLNQPHHHRCMCLFKTLFGTKPFAYHAIISFSTEFLIRTIGTIISFLQIFCSNINFGRSSFSSYYVTCGTSHKIFRYFHKEA